MKKKWKLPEEARRSKEEIDGFLARVLERLGPADHAIARAHVEGVQGLLEILADKNLSLKRLRDMLFGATSEKTSQVLGGDDAENKEDPRGEPTEEPGAGEPESAGEPKKKQKGHGRNGVSEYRGAVEIHVPHATLHSGDLCPCCENGRVYDTGRPGVEPRIKGRSPFEVRVYRPGKMRCNLCGEVFTAELPKEAGSKKYDETVASVIALLKYGTGVPFKRLETLQDTLGVPLPAANQWELSDLAARSCAPALDELARQAAQGDVVHNDDTTMKILGLNKKAAAEGAAKRKGVFTTGIISKTEERKIALFFTGRKHAGENLAELLAKRSKELGPPIQMCDGLNRNVPKSFKVILSNCSAHGRRKFVELKSLFPEECHVVIEIFREVYHNDELASAMSKEDRLRFHKERSGPLMERLEVWLKAQFAEKKVEPNSSLGKAITYLLKRWKPLTRFLEVPGAPLDNNICEQMLKLAIMNRKNAYFYRTEKGAWVGDLFMSLIHTTRLHGENPFEYLTALQKNAARVRERPGDWMPWNYRATLASLEGSQAAAAGSVERAAGGEKAAQRSAG
jgi:transposase